jgi:metacaspase-1
MHESGRSMPGGARPFATVVAAAACLVASLAVPAHAAEKRALIVAVSKYADRDWDQLHAANDATILETALRQHSFTTNLQVLSDPAATKAGFVSAFREHLIDKAAAGDVLVLTFSGHGQRLSDNDGDEADGYDEALVLYDTPKQMTPGYRGERHLRDDELRVLLTDARRKVGPQGHVFVALDSCFSGGGSRAAIALERGDNPLDAPAAGRNGMDAGSGVETADAAAQLGSFVLLTAAQSNEEAREAPGPSGEYYGSLSLALSTSLNTARRNSNYFALHDSVGRLMSGWVHNRPQLEGDREQLLFSGNAVEQQPYFTVVAEPDAARKLKIRAGGIHGILSGARIAFHPRGTTTPTQETQLGLGTVIAAETAAATVQIDEQRAGALLKESWAMVEEYSFGEVRSRVSVAPNAPARTELLRMLSDNPLVTVVDEGADVRFDRAPDKPARLVGVETATDTAIYSDDLADVPQRIERVRGFLRDFTRSRYLRKVEIAALGFDVDLVVTPCKLSAPPVVKCVTDINQPASLSAGGRFTIRVGDGFRLTLTSRAQSDLYVAVLDIAPNNQLAVLSPLPGAGAQRLKAGIRNFNAGEFQLAEPAGAAMLKLIVTGTPVVFDSIASETWTATGKGAMDGLFADALQGKANTPAFAARSVAVKSIVYDIAR